MALAFVFATLAGAESEKLVFRFAPGAEGFWNSTTVVPLGEMRSMTRLVMVKAVMETLTTRLLKDSGGVMMGKRAMTPVFGMSDVMLEKKVDALVWSAGALKARAPVELSMLPTAPVPMATIASVPSAPTDREL